MDIFTLGENTFFCVQVYLSFSPVRLVIETGWEDVKEEDEEEEALWLNTNSLGTTVMCDADEEEVDETESMHPREDRKYSCMGDLDKSPALSALC